MIYSNNGSENERLIFIF